MENGRQEERERREKKTGKKEREREREGTPRNYARVSYGGTSIAVIRQLAKTTPSVSSIDDSA